MSELPRVLVRTDVDLPVSGCTSWQNGRWLIVLNGAEPLVRQHFSLAHEFKHAVDHRFRHELYFDRPSLSATTKAEYAAGYFATCLLMPKAEQAVDYVIVYKVDRLAHNRYDDVPEQPLQFRPVRVVQL